MTYSPLIFDCSEKGGTFHFLSLTTADLTISAALYQLWKPNNDEKLNGMASVFITSPGGV